MDILRAAQPIIDYVPTIQVWGGFIPQGYNLPFLLVRDEGEEYEWITEFSRLEMHRLTLRSYGTGPTVADAANSAEEIMDLAEDALNWIDIMNRVVDVVPGVTPIRTEQANRQRAVEDKRSEQGRYVYRCRALWEVHYGYDKVAWKRW